jgi:hypothetical protein
MSFFFTLLDDSLRPRGSPDPLGIEHLWSVIGRKLAGNLTTFTRHLDNFIVTLVGWYCRRAGAMMRRFCDSTGRYNAGIEGWEDTVRAHVQMRYPPFQLHHVHVRVTDTGQVMASMKA